MSETFWTALAAFLTPTVLAIIAIIAKIQLNKIEKTGKDTHTLVNNAMGIQLIMNYDLANFKALTTKLPEDEAAAKLAKIRLEEHIKKQAIVDSQQN